MAKKKTNIVIFIVIGIVILIVGILIWGFMTNWWKKEEQPTKKEPIKFKLKTEIPKGTVNLPVDNPESDGFKIGQTITIGKGENKEERIIVGFGSLILDRPLEKNHGKESIITVISEPKKEFKKIEHCEIYNEDTTTCKTCNSNFYLKDNLCQPYTRGPYECPDDLWLWKDPNEDERGCLIYESEKPECPDDVFIWKNPNKDEQKCRISPDGLPFEGGEGGGSFPFGPGGPSGFSGFGGPGGPGAGHSDDPIECTEDNQGDVCSVGEQCIYIDESNGKGICGGSEGEEQMGGQGEGQGGYGGQGEGQGGYGGQGEGQGEFGGQGEGQGGYGGQGEGQGGYGGQGEGEGGFGG